VGISVQEITSNPDSQNIEFKKTVDFTPRTDLSEDQKETFDKIGYAGDTFFCAPKNKTQVKDLNYRRLTLGREGILGGMKSPSALVNAATFETIETTREMQGGVVEEEGEGDSEEDRDSNEDDYDSHG